MHIAYVSPSYAPCVGGSERLLQAVAERLVGRGHHVTVVTLDAASSHRDFDGTRRAGLPPLEVINGVRVIRVDPRAGRLYRLHEWWVHRRGGWRTTSWLLGKDFGFWMCRPSSLRMIVPLLRIDADVISSINWCYGPVFWAHFIGRLRRIPHVAIPLLHTDQAWAHEPIYQTMFEAAAGVMVLTEAEREFVRKKGAGFVEVTGAGVDPKRFEGRDGAAIRARYRLGNRPVVGFVGRQYGPKGTPTLIEAMRTVWRERADAVLLLAGPKDQRYPEVTAKLESLSRVEREHVVEINDFANDETASILDACDLLALPSVEESFGMVLVEAWMCEKPVIGADIASTRCIIEPGVDGWIVRPFDVSDLADKILRLLADPAERLAFGRRGRAKVLTRYTWDKVTDAWERTYRQVLATKQLPDLTLERAAADHHSSAPG